MVAIPRGRARGKSFGGRGGRQGGRGAPWGGNLSRRPGHSTKWMAPAPLEPGLRAVPFRTGTDTLVRLGWVLLAIGLVWPWIAEGDRCERVRFHGVSWIIDRVELAIRCRIEPLWAERWLAWWCALPLAYGFALPALWCSRYRQRTGVRLVMGWGWLAATACVLVWAWSTVVLDWENLRWAARTCPQRSFHWVLQPVQPDGGFYLSAVGALLVGACPVVELHRLRRILARWSTRPGRVQAGRVIGAHALPRLCHPLRRLVLEARELRAMLSPFRCIDGEPARRLVEIVGRLRTLDELGNAELRDHGLCTSALLSALAPALPRRERSVDEALRVDAALAELEAVGLVEDGVAPYR